MNWLVPVALVMVLVGASVGLGMATAETGSATAVTAPVDDSSEPISVNESANRLPLAEPVTADQAHAGPDLGATLAGTDDAIRADQVLYASLGPDYDQANLTERSQLLDAAYTAFGQELDALTSAETDAFTDHASGEIGSSEFLSQYQRTTVTASYLDTLLDGIADRSDGLVDSPVTSNDLDHDRSVIEMYTTQIGTFLDPTATSLVSSDTHGVHVQTTDEGYSLSLIEDDTWYLETVRTDHRDVAAETQFDGITDAFEYAGELYPWTSDQRDRQGITERGGLGLYDISMPHGHGSLNAFLDGGTGEIYREYHELSLPALEVEESYTETGEGLTLTVNETSAAGPLEVTVTDESGDPIEAELTTETTVGETDAGGTTWILPQSPDTTLEATTDDGDTVSVQLSP